MRPHSSTSSFRNKDIFYILAFIAILTATIYFAGQIFYYTSTQNKINIFSQQRFEDFYASDELDLIFVGSSHSYCTFDPEVFNQRLGLNSYQLGMPSQTPDGTYYTLLEVLNYQKPKAVVMELYYLMLSTEFDMKQFDQLFQFLDNPELKKDYISNVFPLKEKAKYYIPTIHYQTDFINYANAKLKTFFETNFGLTQEIKQSEGIEQYRSFGYVYCDYAMDSEDILDAEKNFYYDGNSFEIADSQIEYIRKIVSLCEDNDIQLFFMTAPISNAAFNNIKNYDAMYNKISDLCGSLKIDYIDYNLINKTESLLTNNDFRDKNHLNHSGVTIISNEYADYLSGRLR